MHRQNFSDLSQADSIHNEPTFKKVEIPEHHYTGGYVAQNEQIVSR